MTNKEKISESINNNFNKDNNYNEIIKMIEKENEKSKNKVWKMSLVPICLVIMIISIIFMNDKTNNLSRPNLEKENNIDLNINNIDTKDSTTEDSDVRKILMTESTIQNEKNDGLLGILKNKINIPKDLDTFNSYKVYTRNDKNGKYNILDSYVYCYSNEDDSNYKEIRIAFSKNNKPIRDYYFSHENSKETIINNVKLIVFKYNRTYYVEFTYNDYYFDIETNNISKNELLKLLVSIVG